jgi:hypothetical protein
VTNFSAVEIERLVREVLAQLAPKPAPREASTTELWLDQSVVAVRDLEGRLQQVKQLVVPERAIVTPAARDLLRERGVDVRRAATASKATSSSLATLLLGVAETRCEPTEVIGALRRRGVQVEQVARTGLKTVVAELADAAAKGGRRTWLLTEATHQAICLANRTSGVWAAAAQHRGELAEARKAISLNVLITNPVKSTTFQLTQLGQEYAK